MGARLKQNDKTIKMPREMSNCSPAILHPLAEGEERAGQLAITGSRRSTTCDRRSAPRSLALQHRTAWPQTRRGVQHSGHKVQETISGRGKAYHTVLSPGQQNRPIQAQLAERKHAPRRAAAPAQQHQRGSASPAAKGQPGLGSLPALQDHPSQATPHHTPARDLRNSPHAPGESLHHLVSLWHSMGIALPFRASVAESSQCLGQTTRYLNT